MDHNNIYNSIRNQDAWNELTETADKISRKLQKEYAIERPRGRINRPQAHTDYNSSDEETSNGTDCDTDTEGHTSMGF